jgi:transcriptional regulator with XRE-family HTH domain
MEPKVDKDWFKAQLAKAGLSMRAAARMLGIDASALSRTLNGERRFKLEEVRSLAEILAVPADEIMAHASGAKGAAPSGFGEPSQAPYSAEALEAKRSNKPPANTGPPGRSTKGPYPKSPLFGCLKGIMVVGPGVDLTQPADPDWGKVYDD